MTVASAAYDNTHVNTGNMAFDIVAVAETQIGYIEGSLSGDWQYSAQNNVQKYGVWYVENVEALGTPEFSWEAAFVSWCANQAGVPSDIVYYHAYCPYGVNWFKNQGLFEESANRGGSYVPKTGDLIYFAPMGSETASHVGIVRYVQDGYVYTVEGNTVAPVGEQSDNGVYARNYSLAYQRILGYATPQYTSATLPENTLSSDVFTVDGGVVGGVPCGTIAQLTDRLSSAFTMTVKENGIAVADDGIVKTGQRIDITDGDTVIMSYVIAVSGDFNGDGRADTTDARDILCNIASYDAVATVAQRVALGKEVNSTVTTSDARHILRSLVEG